MRRDSPGAEHAALIDALIDAVGPEHAVTSEEARELASQDVYRSVEMPLAVVSPGSTQEVQAVLRACHAHAAATFVRGGGMSYTDAFLPDRERSIVLDTGRLNAVREINAHDLYATVEAGCTWSAVDAELAEHGLRSVFWGRCPAGFRPSAAPCRRGRSLSAREGTGLRFPPHWDWRLCWGTAACW